MRGLRSKTARKFDNIILFNNIFDYVYYCSIRLSMIEITLTRPLTIYNSLADKFSTFSRAKPSRSAARLVKIIRLNSFTFVWKCCNTSKSFRAFFVHCFCLKNDSFLSVFCKLRSFLSLFFSSNYQLCVVGLNAPRWLLYPILYQARSRLIIVKYIYI